MISVSNNAKHELRGSVPLHKLPLSVSDAPVVHILQNGCNVPFLKIMCSKLCKIVFFHFKNFLHCSEKQRNARININYHFIFLLHCTFIFLAVFIFSLL